MSRDIFKQTFYGLSLLLFSTQLHAEQWYHVELVVFENLNSITDEQDPIDNQVINATLSPFSSTSTQRPDGKSELVGVVSKLARSNKYRVHYYEAWQQRIMTKRSANSLVIEANDGEVSGEVKLYKSTYLHAKLDLWIKHNTAKVTSWSDAAPEGTVLNTVRNPHLDETRRIRSKKLHYFDTPKLGALLKLTPIATPADIEITNKTYDLPTEAAPKVTQ